MPGGVSMKKMLACLLSVVLVLNLCACGIILPKEVELVALDTSSLGDIFAISHDSNERYTALYYSDYIEANPEDMPEEESAEPEEIDTDYHLAVFDNRRNKLLANIEFENKAAFVAECKIWH